MKRLITALAVAGGLLLLSPSATAGTFVASGTIGAGNPTMPVVSIAPPNCTGQGAFPVHYDVYQFTVDVTGDYTFDLTSTPEFASLYLFQNNFNPAAAFPDCIAADNAAPVGFVESLTALTTYFVVPFDDRFAQTGGNYTLTINGPGNITVVGRVSEPASALLLAAGFAAWLGARTRTRRRVH